MLALRGSPSGHGPHIRGSALRRRRARARGDDRPRVAAAVAWLVLALMAYLLAGSLAAQAVGRLLPDDGWLDLVALLGPP